MAFRLKTSSSTRRMFLQLQLGGGRIWKGFGGGGGGGWGVDRFRRWAMGGVDE